MSSGIGGMENINTLVGLLFRLTNIKPVKPKLTLYRVSSKYSPNESVSSKRSIGNQMSECMKPQKYSPRMPGMK